MTARRIDLLPALVAALPVTLRGILPRKVSPRSGGALAAGAVAILATMGISAAGQTAPPESGPDDQQQEQQEQQQEQKGKAPTLDELLGLTPDESEARAAEQADKATQEELERRLSAAELRDLLTQALEQMAASARLLDIKFESGVGTQRVQLDVLEKLDQLIDQARQAAGEPIQMSSSGDQQQQGQRQPQPGPSPSQAGGQRRSQSAANEGAAIDPPPRRDGDINTVLEESGTEWGHLPERYREMLLQGRREKFSSLYERLTREYYRRLAGDG